MDEKSTSDERLVAGPVNCLACGHRIPDPGVVARCRRCGWQEKRGAD